MTAGFERKIVTLPKLCEIVAAARSAGKTIVQCHGCFDVVHPGHVRYLRFARQLGDVLVVSLTGDRGIEKGPDRPYIPQELRAENLAALEFVDWVVIDPHPTAAEILNLLRPDVYVKGREYALTDDPRFLRERQIVESYGGRVVFHSGDVVFSSTQLLENLTEDRALDEDRRRAICRRHKIDLAAVQRELAGFRGRRAVVAGDLVRERYVLCDATNIAENAPMLALRALAVRNYWGGAAAVALQLNALGLETRLLGAAGTDPRSTRALRRLHQAGLTVATVNGRRELVCRSTFVADDAKVFQVTAGQSVPLDSATEKRAANLLRELALDADVLVWVDQGFGLLTAGLLQSGLELAADRGLPIVASAPGQRSSLAVLQRADLAVLSERRLRELMHDMTSGVPAVVWNLLTRTQGRSAIIWMRKRGLISFQGRRGACGRRSEPAATRRETSADSSLKQRLQSEFVPSAAQRCVDWLGAEEAVVATAAAGMAAGAALPLTTYLAAAAEAISVSRPGNQPFKLEQLESWLHARPELRRQSELLPDPLTAADIALLAPPLQLQVHDADD